ncbi:MAG: dual OB domain-containing protein [Hyalangium sp.]|uniref:dual OB domain-containing protein n=1 Tax=Hyalangium sp. TaxID=2028555 RepID=UPI003899C6F0
MTTYKTFVCFANSRKLAGRCVAGKEWRNKKPGQWLRPISDRQHEEISAYERRYQDGSDPELLDIIKIPLLDPRPRDHQVENHLIDSSQSWEKVGRLEWDALEKWVDSPKILWRNNSSSRAGCNDRVILAEAQACSGSLYLLKLDSMSIQVFAPGASFGDSKRRVQGKFYYNKILYELWITDPLVEKQYLAESDGEYEVGESYVTVSLGEMNKDGYCYKLVAGLVTPDRA